MIPRVAAAFAAIPIAALVGVLTFAALLLIAHIAQVPNAYDSNREYGSAPDTWAETFQNVAISTGIVLVVMLLLTGIGALLWFAVSGRWLSRRTGLAAPGAFTAVVLVALLGWLYADRGSAEPFTDCDEFRFDRAAFVSPDRERWKPQTRGLDDCHLIDTFTRAQIVAKLGRPDKDEFESIGYHGGQLVIEFDGEGVAARPVSVWAW